MIVERIFTIPKQSAAPIEHSKIVVESRMGIVGDRYFGRPFDGQNITLIEAEEIEKFYLEQNRIVDMSITRRNLVVRNCRLNDLVKKEFTVGNVKLFGVRLCDPCLILGKILEDKNISADKVVKSWIGRGGLRANVLSSGEIKIGSRIYIPNS